MGWRSPASAIARLRPDLPIHAVTDDERVARRLMLHRGVEPIVVDQPVLDNPGGVEVERYLAEKGVLRRGEPIVFVSINADLTRPDANFLRIRRVG